MIKGIINERCLRTSGTAEIQIVKAAKNNSKSTLLNCLNTIAMFDRQTAMPCRQGMHIQELV